jgi:hypothetical protein
MRLTSVMVDSRHDSLMSDSAVHYKCTLFNNGRQMTFYFSHGSAICHDPILSDVLESLESDSSVPDTFEEFCSEFGYDVDSRKAESMFKACKKIARDYARIK